MTSFTAGALFSGIGGMCLGFRGQGVRHLWAVDNDDAVGHVYRHNFPDVKFLLADVRQLSAQDLTPVDILHAGFPCQPFSQAGARRGFHDDRGQLVFEILRLVKEFGPSKPKVLVFENAPFLRYGEGGNWFATIVNAVKRAGYWFRDDNAVELNARMVSELPQDRVRLFLIAFSTEHFKSGRFEVQKQVEMESHPLAQYVKVDGVADDEYYLPTDSRYYKMIMSKVQGRDRVYQLRKYEVRAKAPGVVPTLTANMGAGGHNVPFVVDDGGLRKLTDYECLKLQGFPESFEFPEDVPRYRRYEQIGNAVAVPVASHVAATVLKKMRKELASGG